MVIDAFSIRLKAVAMGWFDSLFGDDTGEMVNADGDRPDAGRAGDPFGRILPAPVFDAFREAWKAGAGLFDLFGKEPVKIKEPVGPEAPNRRPDVAKVETFLDRTGYLDLAKAEGPTGYYGSRVDQGIRGFQKENALKVDGLINPDGETLQTLGALLSEGEQPSLRDAGLSPMISPSYSEQAEAMARRSALRPCAQGRAGPAVHGPGGKLARKIRARLCRARQPSATAEPRRSLPDRQMTPSEMVNADGDRPDAGRAGDPFDRILPAPVFDAFREAWKAGASLFDLFGKEPVKIKEPPSTFSAFCF